MNKEEFDAVVISLEVDTQPCLFLLLCKDGTVNRLGTGTLDNSEKALFVGESLAPFFKQFMARVNNELLDNAGAYRHPDPKGRPCKLVLAFRRPKDPLGFEFHFGTESEGPPAEVSSLVSFATQMTEEWYAHQKEDVAAQANEEEEA